VAHTAISHLFVRFVGIRYAPIHLA
jgi:hypothetical protein